jgi:hypothetical protein
VKRRIYPFAKASLRYVFKTFSFLVERLYKGLKDGLLSSRLIVYLFLLCAAKTPAFSVLKTFTNFINFIKSFDLVVKSAVLAAAIIGYLINVELSTFEIYIAYTRPDLVTVF